MLAQLVCAIPSHALDPAKSLTQYTVTSWKQRDGFEWPHVWSIAQTADGYLWLGTNGGLIRFDGIRFSQWRPGKGERAVGPAVTNLLASRSGDLWIVDNAGISMLRQGVLTRFGTADGLPEGTPTAIAEGADGDIWVASINGIARRHDGRWERFGVQSGLPSLRITSLYADPQRGIWVATAAGVVRWNAETRRFNPVPGLESIVHGFSKDPSGAMWIADAEHGVGRVNPASAQTTVEALLPPGTQAYALLHDRDGKLWIATHGSGVARLAYDKGAKKPTIEFFSKLQGLPNDSVYCLFEDREGNIWMGTQNGLVRFRDNQATPIGKAEGLASDQVQMLAATNDGSVWVATAAGINRLRNGTWQLYGIQDGLPSTTISALYGVSGDDLLVGTEGGVVQLQGDRFVPLPLTGNRQLSRVVAITRDTDGAIWLCDLVDGLLRWRNGELEEFKNKPGFTNQTPISIQKDRSGRIWIGFDSGTVALHEGGQFTFYTEADGLPGGAITDFYEDDKRRIWVAATQGISVFHRQGKSAKPFSAIGNRNGLPEGAVLSLTQDYAGNFWLASPRGIARIKGPALDHAVQDPAYQVPYQLLDPSAGLRGPPLRLSYTSENRAADGSLWFPTADGVVKIDPKTIRADTAPPPVLIESMVADGVEVRPDSLLPARTSKIRLDYTALSLSTPKRLRFRVMLDGYDRNWVDVGDLRQAYYTNLPPGDFTFRVIASKGDDTWSPTSASWRFSIQPALYQMIRFQVASAALLILVLSGLFLLFYRQRLKRSQQQVSSLQTLTEAIPQLIWSSHPDGCAEYFNRRWLSYTGLSLDSAKGMGWVKAVHPDDADRAVTSYRGALASGAPLEQEVRLRNANGEYRWFLTRAIPMRDANGRVIRWYGTNTDIEDLKRAEADRARLEAQLRQAQKLESLGTLAGGIAHDFNNILGAILGYGEMGRSRTGECSALRQYLDGIMTAAQRGKALIEKILAFGRGSRSVRLPLHVQSLVAEALDLQRASLPPGITLAQELQVDDAAVLGDPTQIHQVVMNLCTNATQAMASGGKLFVELAVATIKDGLSVTTGELAGGDYVRLTVRDQGSGIEASVLDRIFDPFFTTKQAGEGTGLGLSLVHAIVTDLGGGIDVQSQAGHGTTFVVYFPKFGQAPAWKADSSTPPGGDGERILLVDNEPALVQIGEEMIAALGYEPVGFTSSVKALDAFRAAPQDFDAVLSDETMPDLTGSQLAAEIRRYRADIPIVLMSGYIGPGLASLARDAGVSTVLAKPLVKDDIAHSLAAVLPKQRGVSNVTH